MSSQLLYYQSMICQYAQKFTFEDVYTFDRNFRMRLDNNKFLRLDRHEELVDTFLNNNKPVCFKCKNFGHFATACPLSSSPFSSSQNSSSTRPLDQPFRAPSVQYATSHQPPSRPVPPTTSISLGDAIYPRCTYPHTC